MAANDNFSYIAGGSNKFITIESRLDEIGAYLNNSVLQNNVSSTSANVLTLSTIDPLPTGSSITTGSIAFSGSGAGVRMYIFTGNGSIAGAPGWQTASFGG
jgi:hypothetical protein